MEESVAVNNREKDKLRRDNQELSRNIKEIIRENEESKGLIERLKEEGREFDR